ncbi:hypothetical protein D3C72_2060670 [compost metagenome]
MQLVCQSVSRDITRKPCAIVPPYGECADARSGSTWIHWLSRVTRANWSIISWLITTAWEAMAGCPTKSSSDWTVANWRRDDSEACTAAGVG